MLRTMKMDARWQLQRGVTAITFDGDVVIATKETYSGFVPKEQFMQENLDWSFAYFEKNVQPKLYARVHSKWMDFDSNSRGGSLFLKLLLDQVTTTS